MRIVHVSTHWILHLSLTEKNAIIRWGEWYWIRIVKAVGSNGWTAPSMGTFWTTCLFLLTLCLPLHQHIGHLGGSVMAILVHAMIFWKRFKSSCILRLRLKSIRVLDNAGMSLAIFVMEYYIISGIRVVYIVAKGILCFHWRHFRSVCWHWRQIISGVVFKSIRYI